MRDSYRKVIHVGNLPNNDTIEVHEKVEDFDRFKDVDVFGRDEYEFLHIPDQSLTMGNGINFDNCYSYVKDNVFTCVITTTKDRSMYDGYIILEYYKKEMR